LGGGAKLVLLLQTAKQVQSVKDLSGAELQKQSVMVEIIKTEADFLLDLLTICKVHPRTCQHFVILPIHLLPKGFHRSTKAKEGDLDRRLPNDLFEYRGNKQHVVK